MTLKSTLLHSPSYCGRYDYLRTLYSYLNMKETLLCRHSLAMSLPWPPSSIRVPCVVPILDPLMNVSASKIQPGRWCPSQETSVRFDAFVAFHVPESRVNQMWRVVAPKSSCQVICSCSRAVHNDLYVPCGLPNHLCDTQMLTFLFSRLFNASLSFRPLRPKSDPP